MNCHYCNSPLGPDLSRCEICGYREFASTEEMPSAITFTGPTKRRRSLPAVIVFIGVVVLLGTLYSVVGGLQGLAGSNSPLEAAERLASAVNSLDPVAVLAAMDPAEVAQISEIVSGVKAKASALGYVSGTHTFQGVNISLDYLGYNVTMLSDNYAKVTINAGSFNYNYSAKQFSPKIAANNPNIPTRNGSKNISSFTARTENSNAPIYPFLMVVNTPTGWFVSPMLTAAEYLDEIKYGNFPGDFTASMTNSQPLASSPTGAVQQLAASLGTLDPVQVANNLPADEWFILRIYRAAINQMISSSGLKSLSFSNLSLSSQELGNGSVKVTVDSGTLSFVNSQNGSTDSGKTSWDGKCWTTQSTNSPFRKSCPTGWIVSHNLLPDFLVVVNQNGGWVVSPIDTLMEYGREVLNQLDGATMDRLFNLTPSEAPSATLTPGKSVNVSLNDAGAAVIKVSVSKTGNYWLKMPQDVSGYQTDGTSGISEFSNFIGLGNWPFQLVAGKPETFVIENSSWSTENISISLNEVNTQPLLVGQSTVVSLGPDNPVVDYTFTPVSGEYLYYSYSGPGGSGVVTVDGPSGNSSNCNYVSSNGEACSFSSTGEHTLEIVDMSPNGQEVSSSGTLTTSWSATPPPNYPFVPSQTNYGNSGNPISPSTPNFGNSGNSGGTGNSGNSG